MWNSVPASKKERNISCPTFLYNKTSLNIAFRDNYRKLLKVNYLDFFLHL